jgi:hypothetical protein
VTESGRVVEVARQGYRDLRWWRAHQDLVVGRLRQVLAEVPRPAVVYSAEELDLPLVEAAPGLDRHDAELLDALELTVIFATEERKRKTSLILLL